MSLRFTKMHGLGNDFIVVDAIHQSPNLTPEYIQALSCRHTGIGFDQCLVLEKSTRQDIDFFYRIFNADGTSVGQCGNGARCLARFIEYYGFSQKKSLNVATTTTELTLHINADNTVTVDMGEPVFGPQQKIQPEVEVHTLTLGNPHAVLIVDDVKTAPVATLGPHIETHALFPEHTNVGFLEIIDTAHIKLRVHERGAGETRACGSGATAAAAVAQRFYDLNSPLTVSVAGGNLVVDWPNKKGPIFLSGPAEFVYEGVLMR